MDETEGRAKASGLIDDLRVRHDGWTAARQRAFLRALSETGCVRDACARARISNTSAYRMRQRSEAFARAWDRAIDKVMPTIEQAAYERAVLGWEEPIIQGGKVVGGPHDNYALGSRMTLLPWNPNGVVVISLVDGEANMVKMMFDPDAADGEGERAADWKQRTETLRGGDRPRRGKGYGRRRDSD